jgi:acyl carrier protein
MMIADETVPLENVKAAVRSVSDISDYAVLELDHPDYVIYAQASLPAGQDVISELITHVQDATQGIPDIRIEEIIVVGSSEPTVDGRGSPVDSTHSIEAALAKRSWELALNVENVVLADDFLDLGGDSLCAIEISARLEAALAIPVPPTVLVSTGNLAAFAEYLTVARRAMKDDVARK